MMAFKAALKTLEEDSINGTGIIGYLVRKNENGILTSCNEWV